MRRHAFTLIEVLVVISIIALLMGILLPALAGARKTGQMTKSMANQRGIQAALVLFGQKNNGWYPGLRSDGTLANTYYKAGDASVAGNAGTAGKASIAMELLLRHGYVQAEILVCPASYEATAKVYSGTMYGPGVSTDFDPIFFTSPPSYFSYAVLDYNLPATTTKNYRKLNWRDNGSGFIPVLCDRNTGTAATGTDSKSVWSQTSSGNSWQGHVAWNDGHVTYENKPTVSTRFDDDSPTPTDTLFPSDTAGQTPDDDNTACMTWY